MTKSDLDLRCPACEQRFGVSLSMLNPQDLRIACSGCAHTLSPDEILNAMAVSLNELLDKTRDRLTDSLDKPDKPET